MPYLTPESIPEGTVCRPLLIPNSSEWLAIVSGALTELIKSWNWEQQGAVTVQEALDLMQTMIDNYYSQECCMPPENCPCPPIFRQGSLGQEQVSFDAGETWTDVAQPDLPIPPTIAGQSSKCLSARNLTEVTRLTYLAVVEAFEGGGSILLGITAFISVLATTIFFPPAAPLVSIFFGSLWAVLSSLVAGDFGAAEISELTCLIYNVITEDASSRWVVDLDELLGAIEAEHPTGEFWAAIGYILRSADSYSVNQALQTRSVQEWDCADCEPVGEFINFENNDGITGVAFCDDFSSLTTIIDLGGGRWRLESDLVPGVNRIAIRRPNGEAFAHSNTTIIQGTVFNNESLLTATGLCAGGGSFGTEGVSIKTWSVNAANMTQLILETDLTLF